MAIKHILSPEKINLTQNPPSAQITRTEININNDADSDSDSENLNSIENGDEF